MPIINSCLRKATFDTESDAEAAQIKCGAGGWYKCFFCPFYHLTSQLVHGNKSRKK